MRKTINTGGPAFPRGDDNGPNGNYPNDHGLGQVGMTMRQHYAGLAMQAILQAYFSDKGRIVDMALIAKGAFSAADAMIAAEVQS